MVTERNFTKADTTSTIQFTYSSFFFFLKFLVSQIEVWELKFTEESCQMLLEDNVTFQFGKRKNKTIMENLFFFFFSTGDGS